MTQRIPVFFATDENYVPYMTQAIISICENTKSPVDFYVMHESVTDESQRILSKLVSSYTGKTIEFINLDFEGYFEGFQDNTGYITKTTYYRFLIPTIKPELDKVIYLDGDLVVEGDLIELYNQDLGEYALGACCEEGIVQFNITHSQYLLSIPQNHCYFNAGVLLINSKKWREDDLIEKSFFVFKKHKERLLFADQDVLNKMFSPNAYKRLEKKYNWTQKDLWNNPKFIIHYNESLKPWRISPDLEQKELHFIDVWAKYTSKNPFKEKFVNNLCKDVKSIVYQTREKECEMPLISVIFYVYNAEQYLYECLFNLTLSNLKKYEVICVDNGSIDGSLDILKKFAAKDGRFRIINMPTNCGVSAARNVGIENARGKYLYFLDSNTIINDKFLLLAYNKAVNNNVDLVFMASERLYSEYSVSTDKYFERFKSIGNEYEFLKNFSANMWDKLYSREFITKNNIRFDEKVKIGEDILFNFNVYYYDAQYDMVSDVLCRHMEKTEALAEAGNHVMKYARVLRKGFEKFWFKEGFDSFKQLYLDACYICLFHYFEDYREEKYKETNKYVIQEFIDYIYTNVDKSLVDETAWGSVTEAYDLNPKEVERNFIEFE